MKFWAVFVTAAFLSNLSSPVTADPGRGAKGNGHNPHGKYARKEEYWDGNCKVERKWKRNGDYKEERKCKGHGHGDNYYQSHAPQVVVNLPPWFDISSGEPEYAPDWVPASPPRASGGITHCNNSQVGSVLGGIIGGVLGHQIGGGRGKTAATIGGAIAGVFIGGDIGRKIDAQSQACIAQVLEFAPPGEAVAWQNSASHETYTVLPGQVEKQGDAYCRAFTTEVQGGERSQITNSKACRRSDGVWVNAL